MKIFCIAGILLSFLFFLAALRLVAIKIAEDYFSKNKKKGHGNVNILLLILISIWIIRFTIGLFSAKENPGLLFYDQWSPNLFEVIFDSFLHALQTFSMDESYTDYLYAGRIMMNEIANNSEVWANAFGVYMSILNFSAPVAGSVVILQFLTGLFPGLRFKAASSRFSHKKKHIFSELNEHSLAVAKSVIKENPDALIIFTDVYTNNEIEKESELFKDAKKSGAICLKDDLFHLNFVKMKDKIFYFIDIEEMNNIEMFSKMASREYYKALLNHTKVLIYYDDDSLVTIQRSAYQALESMLNKNGETEQIPEVYRRDCNNELVLNILHRYPLFVALKDNPDKKDLKVSIIGGGSIGLKMFLNAYWFGQIHGIKLHLNVLASESENVFAGRVDGVNPEILKTAVRDDEILSYNPDDNQPTNDEYFKFGYSEKNLAKCNIKDIEFEPYSVEGTKGKTEKNKADEQKDKLVDSDYILVALGSDESNIYYANVLSREIELYQKENDGQANHKVTILYVVYDPEISEMLNSETKGSKKEEKNITATAVGNVEEIYSEKNITGRKFRELVNAYDNAYAKISGRVSANYNSNDNDNLKKIYAFESTVARAVHLPYDIYSAFNLKGVEMDIFEKEYQEIIRKEALERFFDIIKDEDCNDRLGWVEHRRWNAYLRSRGYRYSKSIKDHRLKIHTCLVESSPCGDDKLSGDDKLDVLGVADNCDYKVYDKPSAIFSKNQESIIKYYERKLNNELYS